MQVGVFQCAPHRKYLPGQVKGNYLGKQGPGVLGCFIQEHPDRAAGSKGDVSQEAVKHFEPGVP